jgi:hypothetical protein
MKTQLAYVVYTIMLVACLLKLTSEKVPNGAQPTLIDVTDSTYLLASDTHNGSGTNLGTRTRT